MTHEETIKRIQKLVPSTVQTASHLFKNNNLRCSHCGATSQQEYDGLDCTEKRYKPITLAVVLKATKEVVAEKMWAVSTDGEFFGQDVSDGSPIYHDIFWNLSKDNFNDQSEETKAFIGGLLTNNSQEE